MWVGLTQSVQEQKQKFPEEEGLLSPDSQIEILLELPDFKLEPIP